MISPRLIHLDCHSLDDEYYSDSNIDSNSHSIYRLQFVSSISSAGRSLCGSQDIDPTSSPFIPPGESISPVFVFLKPVSCLDLIDERFAWHVIRSAHPVDVAIGSSLVLAHWIELLSFGTVAADRIDLIPTLLQPANVDIPLIAPTIAAPYSSHGYCYYNPLNIPS